MLMFDSHMLQCFVGEEEMKRMLEECLPLQCLSACLCACLDFVNHRWTAGASDDLIDVWRGE